MIPEQVRNFLIKSKEEQNCFCLAINEKLEIIQYFGKAKLLGITPPHYSQSVHDFMPSLLTESFTSDFKIPFFNITDDHVCNIYFLKLATISYLILVDKSEIFKITKKYQQFAHNDNISKNKFKRLAEELSEAQKKLKKSNQQKAALIAMLSHELGTPLTSILGYSEVLQKDTKDYKKGLEIINRNAVYLKNMIENTLLFGQSEAGAIQTYIESISIQQLFSVLKAIILPAAQKKHLSLNMFYKGDEVINIDITRTKQILINLLNNAVKYTQEGSIELKFSRVADNYVFSVIDTGLGVPEHLQKTIFNPWERIEENKEKGLGIGLFISQNLSKAIGGKLSLKYSSAEFGSIFQLVIPATDEIKQQKSVKELDLSKCHNKNLLVIDDDCDILELIEALLHDSGLKIFTTTNLNKAQEIIENKAIDIILTDLNLGPVKASDFINEISGIIGNTPVILMSAMPSKKLQKAFTQQGFKALIEKPLNTKKLLSAIINQL